VKAIIRNEFSNVNVLLSKDMEVPTAENNETLMKTAYTTVNKNGKGINRRKQMGV